MNMYVRKVYESVSRLNLIKPDSFIMYKMRKISVKRYLLILLMTFKLLCRFYNAPVEIPLTCQLEILQTSK